MRDFGERAVPVASAGQLSSHLPQLVQASKLSLCVQEKSCVVLAPTRSSDSGGQASRSASVNGVLKAPLGFPDLRKICSGEIKMWRNPLKGSEARKPKTSKAWPHHEKK